jgi:hypothetical protein
VCVVNVLNLAGLAAACTEDLFPNNCARCSPSARRSSSVGAFLVCSSGLTRLCRGRQSPIATIVV